ncbi:hypothetical protein PVAG01_00483 [Phlyctema vagabunda]|uniref:Uncharacterized protein n=1 Tax=Phlyctema vagabunda TaxID=108571 RepID=A0ABR4PUD2_9HELO
MAPNDIMAPNEIPRPEGEYPMADWLPIYNIRTPYNEDEIVSIIAEITRLYASLSSIGADEIVWSTVINESLCHELSIDPAVISLIRRFPDTNDQIFFDPDTRLIKYRRDETLRSYRAQEGIPPLDLPEGQQKILPHEVCIASGERDGKHLYLDTKENTIRVVSIVDGFNDTNPPGAYLEYPNRDHYRDYFPRHAPSYLRTFLNRIKFLDVIPPEIWSENTDLSESKCEGDSLWYSRWIHTWFLQPEFIEILSWNDYSESHYIGPLRDNGYVAFITGKAPYNYASQLPHDGWRLFLPYVINIYKTGTSKISQEGLVAWFRPNPAAACATGGTTGNTASHLQILHDPRKVVQDKIFYSALLASPADIKVTIGGVDRHATWTNVPDGGVGLYHGSASYTGTGRVVVTISRPDNSITEVSEGFITTACTNTVQNWNAWVGYESGGAVSAQSPGYLTATNCNEGTGPGDLAEICSFTCRYNYCPTVCTCTSVGEVRERPTDVGDNGCPASGKDATYLWLCSFSCKYGYCPKSCDKQPAEYICTALEVSASIVPSCVAGTSQDKWTSICGFTCKYGFCPNKRCTCAVASPTPNIVPARSSTVEYPVDSDGEDYGLCNFACNRGFCPTPPCTSTADLAAIGDDVTSNPGYAQRKLAVTTVQNTVNLVSYWSKCAEDPQCAPGFYAETYIHGKIFDGDKNTYIGDGCHGGGNGFNRALCLGTGVITGSCNYMGNLEVANRLVQQEQYYLCPATNFNNLVSNGFGAVAKDMANVKKFKPSYMATGTECAADDLNSRD